MKKFLMNILFQGLTNLNPYAIIKVQKGKVRYLKMTIEMFEIMGDAMDEVKEWEDFEADMATNPWD